MKKNRRAGFTLSEMAIASVLFSVVIGAPAALYLSTNRLYRRESAMRELEAISRSVMTEIAARLRLASSGVTALTGLGAVDFQRTIDYVGGAPVWSAPERFERRYTLSDPNDGVDNDSDGVVDEGGVFWVENIGLGNERSRRIGEWVRESLQGEIPANFADDNGNGLVDEPGLAFQLAGERVNVWLTLERNVNGNLLTYTAQRSIAFRNK